MCDKSTVQINADNCIKLPKKAIRMYDLKEKETLLYFKSSTQGNGNCVILRKNIE